MAHKVSERAYSSVRRSNLTWLIVGLLVAGIAVGVLVAAIVPYFVDRSSDPTVYTEGGLGLFSGEPNDYNAAVKGEAMFDTRWVYEETTTVNGIPVGNARTTLYYGALLVGEKFLIMELPNAVDDTLVAYTGTLRAMESDIRRDIVGDLVQTVEGLTASDFYPLVLDTRDHSAGWTAGAVGTVVFILAGLWGVFTAVTRMSNPLKHPALSALKRYGDPKTVLQQMDMEQTVSGDKLKEKDKDGFAKKIAFTPSWVYTTSGPFVAAKLEDVAWLYKFITTTKAYGFITTGKTYEAFIWDKHGVKMGVKGKEKIVDAILQAVNERVPWAIGGFTKDLEAAWQKKRPEFLQAVDTRHQQYLAQTEQAE